MVNALNRGTTPTNTGATKSHGNSTKWDFRSRDKKEYWHQSIKESRKREDDLLSLPMEFKVDFRRGKDKKE